MMERRFHSEKFNIMEALGGDFVVGVVQQDGELPADGDQLHAGPNAGPTG